MYRRLNSSFKEWNIYVQYQNLNFFILLLKEQTYWIIQNFIKVQL